MIRRTLFAAAPLAALLLATGEAGADPPPDSAPPADNRALAKDHYARGYSLLNQQSWAAALTEFREAYKLYPAWSQRSGEGTCLMKLGRFDEAMDAYAAMIHEFGDKIPPKIKQQALQEVEEAKRLVGTIEVDGSEPGAAIVIDQLSRGDYPSLAPLRVPAGSHIVRVYKEGYEPFETRLDVAGGTTGRVTAKLRKLEETGKLSVAESLGRTLDVVVDGIVVGQTGKEPLLLPLKPGKHTVFVRGDGNLGTAPTSLTIRVNDVEPLRIEAEALDAMLRVEPEPFDALVSVDSVLLGRGVWDGRVRPGKHKIEIAAEGFLPETRTVLIRRDKREVVAVPLPRDPKSPFWRKPPPPPHFVVELGAAPLLGDVAGNCVGECSGNVGLGTYTVLRGGYELSSGLGFGVSAGALTMTQKTTGRTTTLNIVGHPEAGAPATGDSTNTGTVEDVLRIRGVLLGAWVGYSLDVGLPLHFRLGAGGLFGAASDARRGAFTASDGAPYWPGTYTETHAARFVFVTPEVRVGLPLGKHVEINAGLEVPVLFGVSSPSWSDAHAVRAGSDGYGWFDRQQILRSVIVSLAPTVGARFDL